MAFNDGIDRKYCFSLTDFHEFDRCSFRFFVLHHLNKKYELAQGSENLALGSLLDMAIKLFHESKAYGSPPEYIENLMKRARSKLQEKIATQKGPSFYSSIADFLNDELSEKATKIFISYYKGLNGKIKQSIEPVGFCEWIIATDEGNGWKLWGGPDTLEMGEDGIPEIADYKFHEVLENGKNNTDMDLMPKLYTLLCAKKLQSLGYKKARFVVRFWQDPIENDFSEEFDLDEVKKHEELFKQRISKILESVGVNFCEKPYCKACSSTRRLEFLKELEDKKLIITNNNLLFAPLI